MALGYKCDGDKWNPQALQAVVKYLNSTLEMNLTKDNIKNRLKNWKKYLNVVSDIQSNQSGFTWDEDRGMIFVTSDMWSSWCGYVESHPDAKGMHNNVIDNWDDNVILFGRDRALGHGDETYEEGTKAMRDEEIEVSSESLHGSKAKAKARPSSSIYSTHDKKKKVKQDSLVEAVSKMASTF